MRVAVVSGASRGIGAATARLLAGRGYGVVLLGRSSDRPAHTQLKGTLREVADDIRGRGGTAFEVPTDMADPEAVSRAVTQAASLFGRIDLLVNNASVLDMSPTPKPRKVDLLHSVNGRGTYWACMAALPHLEASAGQVLTVGPPVDRMMTWLNREELPLAYMVSKYNMTLYTLALTTRVCAQTLWPRCTISTAATKMLEARTEEPVYTRGRSPDYFARAVMRAVDRPENGRSALDEDVLPHPPDDAPLDFLI